MKLFFLLCGLASGYLLGTVDLKPVRAEITPDATLTQPSAVTRSGNRTTMTAGTRRGRNLFHSFRDFSVKRGEIAAFQGIDPGIANLFVRVTGNHPSRINGTIEVLQPDSRISGANVFLLNPNGISLGKQALLRIGGSFVASTANHLNFADGSLFSAVQPQTSSPLTVSVPVGLQFGQRPAPITIRSRTFSADSFLPQGLTGNPGQTFAVLGGDIRLEAGVIRTNGGRIELGSVAQAGQVALLPIAQGWRLDYRAIDQFADLQLNSGAEVDASGEGGGEIHLQARRMVLDSALVSSQTNRLRGGTLTVEATDSVVISQGGNLTTSTVGNQRAGDVQIRTGRLDLRNGGQAGSFAFTADRAGRGGDVRIRANSILLAGTDGSDQATSPSALFTQSIGAGFSGDLFLIADRLQVLSGGQISATTFGTGDAGNINIGANQIDLIGVIANQGRPFLSNGLPASGGIFVGTGIGAVGNGGTLNITTDRLTVQEGAILQATTYGKGAAGNIIIRAAESVTVNGIAGQGNIPARIAASSGGILEFSTPRSRQATGRGGNLLLTTGALTVENGGIIAVNSLNSAAAGAGTMQIRADRIQLDNRGGLNAQTESGNDARIQLQGIDLLLLRRNSNISTSAGIQSGGGDGGDVQINADLILSAPAENSDIQANAGQGNGGNIAIHAQGIIGITQRDRPTAQSDITATSELGIDGEISISTPVLDPTLGIVTLPSTIVDASQLIAQGCRARNRSIEADLGEFVITGRGGLPPVPSDLSNSSAVIADWATLETTLENGVSSEDSSQSLPFDRSSGPTVQRNSPASPELDRSIVEAQGWVRDSQGQVVLVAQAANAVPILPSGTLPACEAR